MLTVASVCFKGPFTPSDSITATVWLMGGTVDLFDGTVTHFAHQRNGSLRIVSCEQTLRGVCTE